MAAVEHSILKNTISIPVWEKVGDKLIIASYKTLEVTYLADGNALRIVVNGYLTKYKINLTHPYQFPFKEYILLAISEYTHRDINIEYPVVCDAITMEQVREDCRSVIINNLLPIKTERNRDYLTKYGLIGLPLQSEIVPKELFYGKPRIQRPSKKQNRIKTYPTELILNFINQNQKEAYYVDEEGNRCKLRRASVFAVRGIVCQYCKIEGKFFALEKHADDALHFDLYGIDDNGYEILMTIDHVKAKSKGGRNHIDNYQTLCAICNEAKANFEEFEK